MIDDQSDPGAWADAMRYLPAQATEYGACSPPSITLLMTAWRVIDWSIEIDQPYNMAAKRAQALTEYRPRISKGPTLARGPQGHPAEVSSDGGPAGHDPALRMGGKRETN